MRLLLSLLIFLSFSVAAPAERSPQAEALAQALEQMRQENWRAAEVEARKAGPVGLDIIEWMRLRKGGQAQFDAYRDFLARRPDWPGLDLLLNRGEGSIPTDADPTEVIAYFAGRQPATGNGTLRLVEAHRALGHSGDAEALAVMAWCSLPMDAETEGKLRELYGPTLAEQDIARLDEMLWQGASAAARRVLPQVPEGWQKLAEARMALAAQEPGVDARIEAVPQDLRENAGLAYERFQWRVRKGRSDEAIALMLERSNSPESLGRPEMWAEQRRIYARQLMRDGKAADAYALASRHFLAQEWPYSDLEWLAGYLALKYLRDAELALFHFQQGESIVATPISLSRMYYWQGRAFDALAEPDQAITAYRRGADYQTAFYGLLAAEAAGVPLDPALTGTEVFPELKDSTLADSSVLAAARLLLEAGNPWEAERFLTHLVEGKDRGTGGTLAQEVLDMGEEHIALMIAKRAAYDGIVLPAAYFPLSGYMNRDLPVPREWALAIARRESEFDPVVVSPAGARGLMQLMPGTARDVSADLRIPYDRDGLTEQPAYNVTVGTAYLAGLFEAFGRAPVLVTVGYNAGPGRSLDWTSRYGDPRAPDVDVIDWIEHIPFRETRDYVQRVSESVIVYRARLSGKTGPVEFLRFLKDG
ncbi:lytic transglycosylase domain-containing protein [Tropicimonas sp.]|uniref:lytic transglycosylase domain-containing protein n=1 Tax=Tropicimonas sp. TaxID=2067044 RepID=UPI003A8C041A